MSNLFQNFDFFGYSFPKPQYLGAKYIHRKWIANEVPADCLTVLDAFAGSQSVAYSLKQMGKRVLTNDFLIRPYRSVSVKRRRYDSSRGGKGSVAGSCEILLVCR